MFFLFFIAIPLIEVILFITVGKYIGLWNTIFIIIITGVIGAILVKSQGISILNKAFEEIRLKKVPILSIFEGIAILIAGAFLITPGFLTDTLGCILLIPKTRNLIITHITSYLKKKAIYKEKTTYYSNEKNKENKLAVFLCHPNNPTGMGLDFDALKNCIKKYPRVDFIIDEAFIYFSDLKSFSSLVEENVILLYSLTKVLALPGLRFGYCLSSEKNCKKIKSFLLWKLINLKEKI